MRIIRYEIFVQPHTPPAQSQPHPHLSVQLLIVYPIKKQNSINHPTHTSQATPAPSHH